MGARERARCSLSWCSTTACPSAASTDYTNAAAQELSPRHVPDRFVVVDSVPRTLSGKEVQRGAGQKILSGTAPGRPSRPGRCRTRLAGPVRELAGT
ncbi:acetoacetate--CoA ligase family protein [Pseudonocardia sp. MCCB 268]|nr:acetoacetate--CoA ligase family protein [Pseudonocardia cytotoxica]